jgi:hypothetical protein
MSNQNVRLFVRPALTAAAAMGAYGVIILTGVLKCPMAGLFHVPCPSCGSTRTMKALLSLQWNEAMRFNPLAPLVVALVLTIALRSLWLVLHHGHAGRLDEEPTGRRLLFLLMTLVAAQIALWILRFFGLFGGPCPV